MPERFAQVAGEIYRGGMPTSDDLRYLVDTLGIRRIVSLDLSAGTRVEAMLKQLGYQGRVQHIMKPMLVERVQASVIEDLRSNIVNLLDEVQPVYIHCQAGRDRTGFAVALYRILKGWTPAEAIREAKSRFGFGGGLDPNVEKQLEAILLNRGRMAGIMKVDPEDMNTVTDAPQIVRDQLGDRMSQYEVYEGRRDQFSPITPIQEPIETEVDGRFPAGEIGNVDDGDDNRRERRRKLRRMYLEDLNDAMAQVGVFENSDPLLRGIGPLEPFGRSPNSYSIAY